MIIRCHGESGVMIIRCYGEPDILEVKFRGQISEIGHKKSDIIEGKHYRRYQIL
jgi:hypothetical protein